MKFGGTDPWLNDKQYLETYEVWGCKIYSIWFAFLPVLILVGTIALLHFALGTKMGLICIGIIASLVAILFGLYMISRLLLYVFANTGSTLNKFCSKVNKVVNEVKDSE